MARGKKLSKKRTDACIEPKKHKVGTSAHKKEHLTIKVGTKKKARKRGSKKAI